MATNAEKRAAVVKKYEEILGRNKYSQAKRSYAYKKYSDGKYYSDCSSSIALAHKYAGFPFYDNNGSYNPNTVGMYQAKSLVEVPVKIKNGVIQNPEVLELCDMLLFAGSDSSRKYAGYVGHVEMVGKISGSKITLYGHGSGTPRATEMNAYCKKRYGQKTKTGLGHKGLIKVVRFFTEGDDGVLLSRGSKGDMVKLLQRSLMQLGYDLSKYADDGDYGKETFDAVMQFQNDNGLIANGIYTEATDKIMQEKLGNQVLPATPKGKQLVITGDSVNIRTGPDTSYTIIHTADKGETFAVPNTEGWTPIDYGGHTYWCSDKYSDVKG